jgi:hypothetical protein
VFPDPANFDLADGLAVLGLFTGLGELEIQDDLNQPLVVMQSWYGMYSTEQYLANDCFSGTI